MRGDASRYQHKHSCSRRVRSSQASSARGLLFGDQLRPTAGLGSYTSCQIGDIETVEDAQLNLQFARAKRDAYALEMASAEAKLKECMLGTSFYLKAAASARIKLVDAERGVAKVRAAVRRSGLAARVGAPADPLQGLILRARLREGVDDLREAVAPGPGESDDATIASTAVDVTDFDTAELDSQSDANSRRGSGSRRQRAQSVEVCSYRYRPPEDRPYLIRDQSGRLIPGLS